jgi:hypothetical protein
MTQWPDVIEFVDVAHATISLDKLPKRPQHRDISKVQHEKFQIVSSMTRGERQEKAAPNHLFRHDPAHG